MSDIMPQETGLQNSKPVYFLESSIIERNFISTFLYKLETMVEESDSKYVAYTG
jgi:hypothetical protein